MKLWRARWNLVRLALAAFLLYVVASDTSARLARLELASLPGFDYVGEIRYLRGAGRFGEAEMVADAGLDAADASQHAAIQKERDATVAEAGSYLRKAKDLGLGALSGKGTSIESLVGAVAADMFVVGDVRDLLIQGGRYVLDGETDKVVLILSGVGIATTLAPELDWIPSVLKAAKKMGVMSKGMAEWIVATAKAGKSEKLSALMKDVKRLAAKASPGGAARLLRFAEQPEDVAKLARFVEAEKAGAFALHVTGKEGAEIVKAAADGEYAAIGADKALVAAAAKGPAGTAWLRTGAWRALARPHWLVGIAKGLYKGNAQALAARVAAEIDPRAWWIVPGLAAWVVMELGLLARVFMPRRERAPAVNAKLA
jgi:hypothetical protein